MTLYSFERKITKFELPLKTLMHQYLYYTTSPRTCWCPQPKKYADISINTFPSLPLALAPPAKIIQNLKLKKIFKVPGWCGSVDWVLACEARGHYFDSQWGHMPGLRARSPLGGNREATTHWCFPLSLESPLKIK